jgi:hypothetical protein
MHHVLIHAALVEAEIDERFGERSNIVAVDDLTIERGTWVCDRALTARLR